MYNTKEELKRAIAELRATGERVYIAESDLWSKMPRGVPRPDLGAIEIDNAITKLRNKLNSM